MNHFELVAPAGSLDKLRFAIEYGADAVYLGAKSFSLREGAANFRIDELNEGVEYTHRKGRKAYLAANIFFHDSHFNAFKEFLEEIKFIPIDGIIISDIGAVSYVREKYPDISIHVSTQANTTNSETAKFYERLGVKRIILARELNLEEIKRIRDRVSLDLEVFVHGAMCISYSGRCLLSNYFTNQSIYKEGEKMGGMKKLKTRDANLGDCAQSCRWEYFLVESTRKNDFIPLEENESGTAILSSKDLNLSAHVKQLMDSGINAFKIEGRMKSIYYVSNVTRVYRHCIDAVIKGSVVDSKILEEVNKVSHREYTTGFYFKKNEALCSTKNSSYIREYVFLGHVIEKVDKHRVLVKAMNQIINGFPIEIVRPDFEDFTIEKYAILKEGKAVDKVHPGEEFILNYDGNFELDRFDILRRNG